MKLIIKTFIVIALSFTQQYVYGATYYIDSRFGNDLWSGKLPAATNGLSPDGPWQSLNRLSRANLLPGDIVELQCRSKWTQTLRINSSGTSDQPIIIRPSSSTCDAPPSIDGSQVIQADGWVVHSNAIYKASWPPQKLRNGSLASGVTNWTSWSEKGDQKLASATSCPGSTSGCASFTSSQQSTSNVANSNSFLVEGGITYNGEVSLRVPQGIKVKVLVRRGSSPYEPISAAQWITGTDSWQKVDLTFVSPYTVLDARLDMEVPFAGATFYFKNASMKPAFASPIGAWTREDLPLPPAYHPNRGHSSTQPDSPYAKAPANANVVFSQYGGSGSTYIDIDSTLQLPQGVAIRPGNRLRVRTQPWRLDEVKITQVQGARLYFEQPTTYPIKADAPFFLLGDLGMLDSAGEWVFDTSTLSAFAWMPDNSNPSGQLRLGVLDKGIDLAGRSNIVIEGIDIRYVGTGIDLTNAKNITVLSATVSNTTAEGILGPRASNITITSSQIRKTGGDAISARDSVNVSVVDNDINQSGVTISGSQIWSLPASTVAAVFTGSYSTITGNRISDVAYIGIWPEGGGVGHGRVERNAVINSCLQLDDCGAIYLNGTSPNTRVADNLIEQAIGNIVGLAPTTLPHAVGIYLDGHTTRTTIEGNTVTGTDYGIQLHDAFDNAIVGNKLFGNRRYQLLLQEETHSVRAQGDLYDNRIEANVIVPDIPAISLMIKSYVGLTTSFGSFERNHYSALLSSRIIGDSPSPGPYRELLFDEWQSKPTNTGQGPDSAGIATYPIGYAASKIASGNIVPNGKLTSGRVGWSSWNSTAPYGQLNLETCTQVGSCLQYVGGGSTGLITSPNFSVVSGTWYRVSFDAKMGATGQSFSAIVRRDGNDTNVGYEALMPRPEAFQSGLEWKRYSFSFKASKTITANDPVTHERGARIDFEAPAGSVFVVANLEMVVSTALEAGLNLRMVSNSRRDTVEVDCPEEDAASSICSNYVRFSDQTTVSWPLRLLPLESQIIFTRDPALIDSDADGIADSQDSCPQTSSGEVTDSLGCALAQIGG